MPTCPGTTGATTVWTRVMAWQTRRHDTRYLDYFLSFGDRLVPSGGFVGGGSPPRGEPPDDPQQMSDILGPPAGSSGDSRQAAPVARSGLTPSIAAINGHVAAEQHTGAQSCDDQAPQVRDWHEGRIDMAGKQTSRRWV